MNEIKLSELCKAVNALVKRNEGSKKVLIPCDEEGNAFHTLWTNSIIQVDWNKVELGTDYSKQKRYSNGLPKPTTLNDLCASMENAIADGLGNCMVLVSTDDEINSVMPIYYTISPIDDYYNGCPMSVDLQTAINEYVVLG